jgi:putative PIN family toxin of toxin-antitoxin system
MANVRVVPDTNVYISALLWNGISHRLLRLAEAGELAFITTPAVMEELREVLGRPEFRFRLAALDTSVAELMESLLSVVEVIQDLPIESVVERDPDDDKIVGCALAAQAEWIVSGDDHLLSLQRYKGVSMVTPRQFLNAWNKAK